MAGVEPVPLSSIADIVLQQGHFSARQIQSEYFLWKAQVSTSGVRGYTITSYRVGDVYYKDDCRRQPGWNSLLKDKDCALTHESEYHEFADY